MRTPRPLGALCLAGLLAGLPLLSGCGGDAEAPADAASTETEAMAEAQGQNTIVLVAEDAGLTTFRTAVNQAGLEQDLMTGGPFTVFAPSDEAFNALPEGALEGLLQVQSRDELRDILTYHVVPREIMSGDLSGTVTVQTLQGQPLTVASEGGQVTLTDGEGNTATVVSADLDADNGVIHVIDAVLMPGEAAPADTTATAAQ